MQNPYHIIILVFLFASSDLFSQGLQQSSVRQVYDFEVGDTFEIQSQNVYDIPSNDAYPEEISYTFNIVLNKQISGDTLTYQIKHNYYSYQQNGIHQSQPYIDTNITSLTYTDLDSTIFWYHTYHALGCDTMGNCYNDTVYIDPSIANKKATGHWEAAPDSYVFQIDTLFEESLGEVYGGYVVSSEDNSGTFVALYNFDRLLYYHKTNSEKWGHPFYFDIVNAVSQITDPKIDVHLFPNPAKNIISVKLTSAVPNNAFINMYDITGRLVECEPLTTQITTFKNQLIPGLYLWKVSSDGGTIKTGNSVIEN